MEPVQTKQQYHTHITSKHRWLRLNLGEVWRYRDLILLFTKRNFVISYKQTILGPAWVFLTPFITSIIYTFVFGGIVGMSTDGVPQILFYLTSNALWSFVSTYVMRNSSTFTDNANVFGKVYFPRLTMPIANMFSVVIQFGVQMIMVVIFLAYYTITGAVTPNWGACLLIPLILLELGVLGIGIGIIVSSLTTKYRDLSILVSFGVQLWMYATPIVYPMSQLEDGFMKTILLINPVSAPVELFRYAILGQGSVLPGALIYSAVFTVVLTFLGIIVFNRVEKNFMDTI
ncbi:MAG: ABC transporter permease [Clostridia bacterium]|nr:ABC transporter permease [Clostridia bacterium]